MCGQAAYKLRVSPVNVYKVEGQLEMHRNSLRPYILRNNLSVGDHINEDIRVSTARRTTTEAAENRMGSRTIPTDFVCLERCKDLLCQEEFGEDNSDCVGSIRVGSSSTKNTTDKHFRLAFTDVDTRGADFVMEFKSTKRFQLFERCQDRPSSELIAATVKSTTGYWGTGDFSIEEFEMPSSGVGTDLMHVFVSTILTFTARLRRKKLRYNPGNPIPWEFKVHLGSKFRGGPCVTMKSYVKEGGYFLVNHRCHFMELVSSKLWMPTWFPVCTY